MTEHTMNWRILVDRFVWSDDEYALSSIPEEISDKAIQEYLYAYHSDEMSLEEIRELRVNRSKKFLLERGNYDLSA